MDSYIIRVQPRDELPFIIDKIINTQAKRVYLLISEQSSIAQHVINLRLLKREADSLDKEIVVVSKSPRVQSLALKASLQVHQETEELKRGADSGAYQETATPKLQDIVKPPQGDRVNVPISINKNNKKKKLEKIGNGKEEARFAAASARQAKKEEAIKVQPKIKQHVYEPEETGQKPAYSKRFIENFWKKKDTSSPESARKIPKVNIFGFLKHIKLSKFLIISLFAASIFVFGVTFYSILPSAKIEISTFVEDVGLQLRIKADANIAGANEENFVIPAQVFEKTVRQSKTVITSGEMEINERARGTIKVFNSFSSAPQTLVATTRFISQDGKLFRIEETVVVPGAKVEGGKIIPSSTEVEVIASEPGDEFNIGPSTFSIPGFKGTAKYLAFYGESNSSMSGGRIAKVKVVSKSDYEGAENQLRDELQKAAAEELKLSLQEGFVVPQGADSVSDIAISSTKLIGEEADEFEMTGSISLKAFVIRTQDVMKLLAGDFEERFEGKRLLLEGQEIDYRIVGTNFSDGVLDLQVTYSAQAAANISEKDIKEGVIGKEEKEVRSFLASYPGVSQAKVTFWPFWVHNIPLDPTKTEIIIKP